MVLQTEKRCVTQCQQHKDAVHNTSTHCFGVSGFLCFSVSCVCKLHDASDDVRLIASESSTLQALQQQFQNADFKAFTDKVSINAACMSVCVFHVECTVHAWLSMALQFSTFDDAGAWHNCNSLVTYSRFGQIAVTDKQCKQQSLLPQFDSGLVLDCSRPPDSSRKNLYCH